MKIAVDSNDGINIAPSYNSFHNYMVFEFNEKTKLINHEDKLKLVKSIDRTENIERELHDCSAVISHCLNKPLFNYLRRSGVDVYITFKDKVDDALDQYFKDEFIHKFH